MSALFALITEGRVSNVIVADAWPDGVDLTGLTPQPGIGWAYDGSVFTAPPAAPQPERKDSDDALFELAEIDRVTGMSRLLRESLAAVLGESSPAGLKEAEQQATAARSRVLTDTRKKP